MPAFIRPSPLPTGVHICLARPLLDVLCSPQKLSLSLEDEGLDALGHSEYIRLPKSNLA